MKYAHGILFDTKNPERQHKHGPDYFQHYLEGEPYYAKGQEKKP